MRRGGGRVTDIVLSPQYIYPEMFNKRVTSTRGSGRFDDPLDSSCDIESSNHRAKAQLAEHRKEQDRTDRAKL